MKTPKIKDTFSIVPVERNGKVLYELKEKQNSYGKFITRDAAEAKKKKLLRDREEIAIIIASEEMEFSVE